MSLDRSLIVSLILLVQILLSACSGDTLVADNARIRGLPPGQTVTGAFLQLRNLTASEQVLVGVTAPFADRAEIHSHSHSDGMMRMRQVERVAIAAGQTQAFEPGGYHIMLFGLSRSLRDGEQLPLILTFASGEQLQVQAQVQSVLQE